MKNPTKEQIRDWTEEEVTKWFLEHLADTLNDIDSVRDIKTEGNLAARCLGRKWAIETIEIALGEVIEEGELEALQEKDTVINYLDNE